MNEPARPAARILVVDDVPEHLDLLAAILHENGHQVSVFTSGAMALTAAEDDPPDLILLDVDMPAMNGYEVCRQLKANARLQDIPVIFVSGLSEAIDKVTAFAVGAVDYVTKPFNVDDVLARVATHLRIRRLQAELVAQNEHLEETVRQRTRQLSEVLKRLTVLDRAKSDFLTLISHELRTPLTGLFGVSELVFTLCGSDPMVAELNSLFEHSRRRITTLLDDALLLTQIEVEGEKFAPKPVPLAWISRTALEKASEFAQSRRVKLAMAPLASCTVMADDGLLVKAVQSLLETAVKFSAHGGVVTLSDSVTPTDARLLIEAAGRTIPPRFVDRFFEVLAISESIIPGGDLGLAPPVAERIISLFGGSVAVENLNPPGIRFSIILKPA